MGLCKSCTCSADVCAHCGYDGVGEFVSNVGGDAHVSGKSVATLLWMELELGEYVGAGVISDEPLAGSEMMFI